MSNTDRKKITQQSRANSGNPQQSKKNPNNNKPNQSQVQAEVTKKASASATEPSKSKAPQAEPKQEQQAQPKEYESIKGFNPADIEELLSRNIDPSAELYKPEQPQPQKNGPWAQKTGTMATGKDFWIELRRQVAVLQRGESTNKGG